MLFELASHLRSTRLHSHQVLNGTQGSAIVVNNEAWQHLRLAEQHDLCVEVARTLRRRCFDRVCAMCVVRTCCPSLEMWLS